MTNGWPKDLRRQASNDGIKLAHRKLRAVGHDDLVVVFHSGHGAKDGKKAPAYQDKKAGSS